ncbi:MAG: hypothetical protein IPG07_16655 [Crocinitomicaceae bacterium]|nr:hypothetical protein [Crocinitomicaceae bacterium]
MAEEISNLVDSEKKTEPPATEKTDSEEISTTKELLESAPDLVDMAYESDLADESAIEIAKIESKTEIPEISKSETVEVKSEVKEIADPKLTEAPADLSNLSFVEWLKYKQNKTLPVEIDSIPEKLEIKTEQPISSKLIQKLKKLKRPKNLA